MLPLGLVIVYLTKILASPLVNISVDETTVNDGGYRLPTTQIPSRYEINMTFSAAVFDGHEKSFEGIVQITFQVTEKRDSIQIHAPVKIISMKLDNIAHAIGDASLNTTTEILTIPLKMMLQPQTNYVITIKYRGQLGMRVFEGIYRSSYKNANGIPEYLVTTQFQATYARKAFPCFDEPKFKARFVISITYPRGFNALSNAPQVGPPLVDRDAVYETATFKETPIMSTYLIAFIVSKFTCTAANTDIDMPYQVCSRNELASLRTFALEYGPKFLKVLENVTAYKFNDHHIGKIDHIGIPDFESEGMENYGVVTYEEGILLHDQNQPSLERTDITLSIIAHETAHMWFGNLVTCEWWDYLFLNEGLANLTEAMFHYLTAFYRVNYDSTLWREIRTILYTNYTEIDVLNRAQIVDDSLNLAKARILTYSEAFKNVIYLISETEYFPWVPAFRTLLLLKTRLGENSVLEKNVDSFMLELMEGVYNSVSFTKLDENDHIYMLKLNLVLGQACKLEKPDCVKTAKKLFKNSRQGKSINKNLKPIVYCNGLRYSNNIEEDWEFLWNKYQSTEVPIEKKIILEALGCTKNITILKKYLEYSVNDSYGIRTHDVPTVWSSVFSSSSEGVDVALDYLWKNYEKLYRYYPSAASIVSEIADRLTTKEQVDKLEDLVRKEHLHSSLKSAAICAVTSAKVNIAWTSAVTSDLERYFNKRGNIASFSTIHR
nr:aminopeptidase N-like [Leptinotarsa decemlineata]